MMKMTVITTFKVCKEYSADICYENPTANSLNRFSGMVLCPKCTEALGDEGKEG